MIRQHLRPAFGRLKLAEVTLERVDELVSGLYRLELSPKHVHNILTLLISLLNFAVEREWLTKAPRVRKPKLAEKSFRYLRRKDEIRRFLDAARDEGVDIFRIPEGP